MSRNITLGFPLKLAAFNHNGPGRISGTVKIASTGETLARRVRLLHRDTGKHLREVWSNEAGEYLFDGLALGVDFIVYTLDLTSTYDGVIADRVRATL